MYIKSCNSSQEFIQSWKLTRSNIIFLTLLYAPVHEQCGNIQNGVMYSQALGEYTSMVQLIKFVQIRDGLEHGRPTGMSLKFIKATLLKKCFEEKKSGKKFVLTPESTNQVQRL